MIEIQTPETELYLDDSQEFKLVKAQKLILEHSLISISKWESKWHKPFYGKQQRTPEETLDYIKCMTLNPPAEDYCFYLISENDIKRIFEYITNPMTATTFKDDQTPQKSNREGVTSELVYYWMTIHNIPMECEKWHINRLFTLIQICSIKNSPPKKMSDRDASKEYRALNAARRKAMRTRG